MPGLGYFGSLPASTTFYALFNGQDGDGVYAIGAATRTGGAWSEYGSNPVLTKGSGWESGHVKDPCLTNHSSTYYCYYAGYNGTGYQIGRATASAHTGAWTKAGGNPLLAFGAGGSFDEKGLNFPTILYEPADTGKEWKCWYGAKDASGNQTIGYAHSSDGLSWTKVGKVLDVGGSSTWDHAGVAPAAIYKSGSTYYLFYQGEQLTGGGFARWQGGYATFTDPEGTYTKYASNPTFLARFNDSGTSVVPTADVSLGATQVHLADTSPFHVGEPVILVDGAAVSIPETFAIVALNSSVLLTLDRSTLGSFTSSPVFRSFAYNSVIPRSVLATATGYEALGSLFEGIEDLTMPSGETSLREGSFGWTQSVLTGNWSYAYSGGLFFPIYAGSTGWHSRSAENPSVIAAP